MKILLYCFTFLIVLSCNKNEYSSIRKTIDLSGTWSLKLDSAKAGISEKWFASEFSDSLILPGSLDENKKGFLNVDTTIYHLNRQYIYYGPAWFRKTIEIPEDWNDKHIELILERTKVTYVWVDTIFAGTSNDIYTPQKYDLTNLLKPGKHMLTIMVDNTEDLVPVKGSHAYSEDTQTNWNGIIGKFVLEASEETRIEHVRVYPDIEKKELKLLLQLKNENQNSLNATVSVEAFLWNSDTQQRIKKKDFDFMVPSGDTTVSFEYPLGENAKLWSESDPSLYKINVTLKKDNKTTDNFVTDIGLRKFSAVEKQFNVNGKTIFLRGEHNACVFPLTGYPPMDTAGWLRIFNIAKSYGLNFYRYHSWTPPDAAFKAADMAGIYMQPELPAWWGLNVKDSSHISFLLKEGKNIMDNYANHASFVMFSLGNELYQERDTLRRMVAQLRDYDPRPLYAHGSNNRLWDPSYAEGDDFWVSFRTGKEAPDLSTDIRGSISYVDSKEGGILNTVYPNTKFTFSKAIENSPVPVMGFEVGQYQVYPYYKAELPKYTGILKPWNLEVYRKKLAEKGMSDQEEDFFKATGALSMICYRADIEAAMRTPNFGGFQLLDLQDYPGQGTALVGVLDAFMESKGLITPEEFRQFCDRVVILLEMDKFCWTNEENFTAGIKIANYSENDLTGKTISWKIVHPANNIILHSGNITGINIPQGKTFVADSLKFNLKDLDVPAKLQVHMSIENSSVKTDYPVWVYPAYDLLIKLENIIIASALNSDIVKKLEEGGNVLLVPEFKDIEKKSVAGQFIPEFWNYMMFNGFAQQRGSGFSPGTLGLLMSPEHPVFKDFPTEYHSNWQWWAITKNSRPIILDNTESSFKPVIQVVDNINRNHKLGLLFEYKVGKGKIVVYPVNQNAIENRPEAKAFYKSILKYMDSADFNPENSISTNELKKIVFN